MKNSISTRGESFSVLELIGVALAAFLGVVGCGGGSGNSQPQPVSFPLAVSKTGTGLGTITSSPAGIDCGTSCSASYVSGSVVTLTMAPAAGSSFAGWSGGGCSGTGTCPVTMDGAKTVAASLQINFQLTVSKTGTGSGTITSSPGGIDCGTTCSASYVPGSVVTLSVAPAAGSNFAGWSGGCSGTGTCTVTMDGVKTVAAFLTIPRVVFDSSRKLDGSDGINPNGTFNIWRVNPDGAALTPLTTATARGAQSHSPQWSPDGTRVAFSSNRKLDGSDAASPNGTFNIWRVNVDGTALTPLTTATARGAHSFFPQWSPDGARVAFHSSRKLDGSDAAGPNRTYNIWRVNADGTALTPLTAATATGAHSSFLQWSPDGARVVFSSSRKLDRSDAANLHGTYNIWGVNADGTALTALTNLTASGANCYSPRWSLDGARVVFSSSRKLDGSDAANLHWTFNIWRVNGDGTAVSALTNATATGAHSLSPDWSPDGTRAAFYSSRNLNGSDAASPTYNIWRVNADGTALTALTTTTASAANSYSPQWSPDGSRVVFRSNRKLDGSDATNPNGTYNIWRISADRSGLTALTNATATGAHSYGPQHSP